MRGAGESPRGDQRPREHDREQACELDAHEGRGEGAIAVLAGEPGAFFTETRPRVPDAGAAGSSLVARPTRTTFRAPLPKPSDRSVCR